MSAHTALTREQANQLRDAFLRGAWEFAQYINRTGAEGLRGPPYPYEHVTMVVAGAARTRFPVRKVTRARERIDSEGREWRFGAGMFWTRSSSDLDHQWVGMMSMGAPTVSLTPERVHLWADLVANPTEEVEE